MGVNNFDIMITHANKAGKIVSINDVPNGKNCNCTCTKCGEPLVAKNNGKVYRHFFAHLVDSDCKGETFFHIEAKSQIVKDSFLMLPYPYEEETSTVKGKPYKERKLEVYQWPKTLIGEEAKMMGGEYSEVFKNYVYVIPLKYKCSGYDIKYPDSKEVVSAKPPRYTKVEFEKIEVEKRIGNSKYIADVICTHKNGTQLIVEIAYSHYTTKQKVRYLKDNKIPAVEISLDYLRSFNQNWEPEKESLSEYMTSGLFTNKTRWLYSSKETPR